MAKKPVLVDLDLQSQARIVGLQAPVASDEPTTKSFVEARSPKITAGTSAPVSPSVGDVWIDIN